MTMQSQIQSVSTNDFNKTTRESIYLIFLGPPGSGKGTQAEKLRDRLGLAHVSSGDLFRENISQGTPLGLKVKGILGTGALVPDDLTVAMVMARIRQPDTARGVIFDGFPRTRGQAIALQQKFQEEGRKINRVIYFHIPDQVIVERLAARRLCPTDGVLYNLKSKPPKNDQLCDHDGTRLIQREDDRPEVVQERLRVYREQTEPLIQYFRDQNLLFEVNADQTVDALEAVFEQFAKSLTQNAD